MSGRYRIWIDNDFAGDPDDLFQLAHQLSCPSVYICGVTASHLSPGDFLDGSGESASHGVAMARSLLELMGREVPVFRGSEHVWKGRERCLEVSRGSEGAEAFAREALRDDARPLFLACGGGLTDTATALTLYPEITDRFTLIWIGGPEYPSTASANMVDSLHNVPVTGASGMEYNLRIDLEAAQYVFSLKELDLWQVPRDTYRQCMVSLAELERHLGETEVGRWLVRSLDRVHNAIGSLGLTRADTYVLGDQVLVLLTALQSLFDPFPWSSNSHLRKRPAIDLEGNYDLEGGCGTVRVFTKVDTRLMFEDMYARLG